MATDAKSELVGGGGAGDFIVNAMSVDVEDYYQVSAFASVIPRERWPQWPVRVDENTRRVLDLFAAADVKATFFILGCVARHHPNLVRRIAADGHEIASHGFSHFRVFEQTPQQFRSDVEDTRHLLEDTAGMPVRGYRAASFSISHGTWWAFEELAAAGYRYSSSVSPFKHDHYGVPDAPRFLINPNPSIAEVPITTVELMGRRLPCGGGGFFRLLPYRWSRWAIRRVNRREAAPAVFYFHPWEIDPGQPRVKQASLRSRFRHYVNLGAMSGKLERLLCDFRWGRLDHAVPAAVRGATP